MHFSFSPFLSLVRPPLDCANLGVDFRPASIVYLCAVESRRGLGIWE